jgi:putative NADH-flavin reductase
MPTGRIILIFWVLYALAFTFALLRKPPRGQGSARVSLGKAGPLRLLIIGATGGTGRELVAQALQLGHNVTALARRPGKLSLQHPNLRVVRGDVLDYASLASVMPGHDAVLSALGHKRFFGPSTILSEGTANILRAMQSAGVARLICESSLGIGNSAGRAGPLATLFAYPLILPFYVWDKLRQEKLIAESDLDWVIVRPAALTNGRARGEYRHGLEAGSYFLPVRIARADVADFMLRQLTDDHYLGSAPGVCY